MNTVKKLALIVAALASVACAEIDGLAHEMADAPTELVCGWSAADARALDELEEGKCWLVTPTVPELATERAGTEPCDVTSGPRVYRGGELFERWETIGRERGGEFHSAIVDCSAP